MRIGFTPQDEFCCASNFYIYLLYPMDYGWELYAEAPKDAAQLAGRIAEEAARINSKEFRDATEEKNETPRALVSYSESVAEFYGVMWKSSSKGTTCIVSSKVIDGLQDTTHCALGIIGFKHFS